MVKDRSLTPQDFTRVVGTIPFRRVVDEDVAFPLLFTGELEAIGWDIPIRVAVDSNHNYYMCNGHGGTLSKCLIGDVIDLIKQNDYNVDPKLLELVDIKYTPSKLLDWAANLLDCLHTLAGNETEDEAHEWLKHYWELKGK